LPKDTKRLLAAGAILWTSDLRHSSDCEPTKPLAGGACHAPLAQEAAAQSNRALTRPRAIVSTAMALFISVVLMQDPRHLVVPQANPLQPLELLRRDASLPEDSAQCALGHGGPRMVWNDGAPRGGWVVPDLVTSLGLAVEDESSSPEFLYHLPCRERGKSRVHNTTGTGMLSSTLPFRLVPASNASGKGSPCST